MLAEGLLRASFLAGGRFSIGVSYGRITDSRIKEAGAPGSDEVRDACTFHLQ